MCRPAATSSRRPAWIHLAGLCAVRRGPARLRKCAARHQPGVHRSSGWKSGEPHRGTARAGAAARAGAGREPDAAAGLGKRHALRLAARRRAARRRRLPEPASAAPWRRARTGWSLARQGGTAHAGALQISSKLDRSLDGDFDLDLPGQSVESVEVLANPFAAECGRFSTSITQIRTRRGTNDWEIKPGNLIPRFRKGLSGIRGFEPRFSCAGR